MISNKYLSIDYRPDIDGLRAIAVLSVIIFHFFPNILPSGFVGVDIFFVISGYLITLILLRNIKNNSFSFKEFFLRRARRIFPVLIVMLITTLFLGYIILLTNEYQQLGKHTFGGSVFISNILLYFESGYFDVAAETKPLLHLWSLGVEEQFYIFFPLLLVLWSIFKKNFLALFFALLIISFALNIIYTFDNKEFSFFMPFTRLWEFIVGSLIAYVHLYKKYFLSKNISCITTIVGLIFISVSIFLVNEKYFPGYFALLPTLGGALIILSSNNIISKYLLSNKFIVFIGLISYPLYLWHFPLFVYANILENGGVTINTKFIILAATILLSISTYFFIERPIKKLNLFFVSKILLVSLSFISFIGLYIYYFGGIDDRKVVSTNINSLDKRIKKEYPTIRECGLNKDEQLLVSQCLKDRREEPINLLIGDSKASSLYNGLVETSFKNNRWMLIGGNGKNGPFIPVIDQSDFFGKDYDLKKISVVLNAIKNNKDINNVVIAVATRQLYRLSTSWHIRDLVSNPNQNHVKESFSKFIKEVLKLDKRVILIVDNPTLAKPQECLTRHSSSEVLNNILNLQINSSCSIAYTEHLRLSKKYRILLDELKAIDPKNIYIFDTLPILCDVDLNICASSLNGKRLYKYTDHMNEYASELVGKKLNNLIINIKE